MRFINLISVILGGILILTGSLMMNKNYKPILAFFIILLGLLLVLGAAFDPDATTPHSIMRFLGLHK